MLWTVLGLAAAPGYGAGALDAALPARVRAETMAALMSAYASPALMAPPAVDPGARVALETLAAGGARLAVISNTMRTPGEVVRQLLDKAGLLSLFRVLTFSDECGIRKPAQAIFLRTLEDLGVPAEYAVHVGDDAPVGFLDQALQHAVFHTQNPEPYTPTRHVVSFLRIPVDHRTA